MSGSLDNVDSCIIGMIDYSSALMTRIALPNNPILLNRRSKKGSSKDLVLMAVSVSVASAKTSSTIPHIPRQQL